MNTKKHIYKASWILSLIATALCQQSCKDYLEVAPTNVVAMQTYADVKAFMGAYLYGFTNYQHTLSGTTSPLRNAKMKMMGQFYSDDLESDKYLKNYTGTNNRGFFYGCLDWKENTIPGIIWKEYYVNIGYFNTVLAELSKLKDISTEEYQLVAGEAKVLRAWYLFKLMQYFSPYKHAELGLPFNLDPDKVGNYDAKRKTQRETYELITKELKEVLDYQLVPKTDYSIFYDKQVINAILAQVYLYKGGSGAGEPSDYESAITYAKGAMKGRGLTGLDNYDPMKTEDDQNGVYKNYPDQLIKFTYTVSMAGLQNIIGLPLYDSSLMQYGRKELYDLYDDQDVRKTYFFNPDMGIVKFEHEDSYAKDIHALFSMAEMQLIIAESYARLEKNSEAQSAYEYFMKHRVRGYSYKGENVLASILTERRKEFCFEDDMRWTDLTRLQTGWSRKALDKPDGEQYTLADGDYRFCFPIPLNEELQFNKIPQNPGWGDL